MQGFYSGSERVLPRFADVNQTQNHMKTFSMLGVLLFMLNTVFAQVSGNANYKQKVYIPTQNIGQNNFDKGYGSDQSFTINIKGLYNVSSNAYVAVFSLTQLGKTVKEVNQLIDDRLNKVKAGIKQISGLELHLDMISFVPQYEFQKDKKAFNKPPTYNETPQGFEIKKNIHIKYQQPNQLNQIIAVCSKAGIYDLVKVDYFSENLSKIKNTLRDKVIAQFKKKLNNYQQLLGVDLDLQNYQRQLADGFKIVYPVEMYHSYQAYSSAPLYVPSSNQVNRVRKTTTKYYQPIIDKEFDVVIHPVVHEPVIQVMYQLRLTLKKKT